MKTPAPPGNEVRDMRLRDPATKRWRTIEVDAALDDAVIQRLNDLAFVHGTEVVSTCAGHAIVGDQVANDLDRLNQTAFAHVRFAIFYRSWNRLAAQQARICIEALARASAGQDTVVETFHEPDLDRGGRVPRGRRLGRSLVIVRNAQPTADAPVTDVDWWRRLIGRLERSGR